MAGLAVLVGGIGIALPRVAEPAYLALTVSTFPIGWCVSIAVLALLYYVVLTPLGLAFRLAGRDPLDRRRRDGVSTYWKPRRPASDPRRYYQQF